MKSLQLDARNLLCPLPVIKVQNLVKTLEPGDTVEVVCTDPGALQDIPSWCRMYGHVVLDTQHRGREVIIRLEVCNRNLV